MIWQGCVIGVAVLASAIHGSAFARPRPALIAAGSRVCAVGALAVLSVMREGPWLLSVALGLSAIADGVLCFRQRLTPWPAVVAFMLAEACLTALFLHAGGGRLALMAEPIRDLGVGAVFAAWVTASPWLNDGRAAPTLNALPLGAMLAVMEIAALTLPRYLSAAIVGALALGVSAILTAAEQPKGVDGIISGQAAWWLYFGGWALIADACLR